MKVTANDFLEAWQGSETLAEVAKRTRLSKVYCSQRAARMRKAGLDLRRFVGVGVPTSELRVPTQEEARTALLKKDEGPTW